MVIGLLETSAKNAQAILELHQELAGCVAIKTTVDDIKTRQLTWIRENITHVTTGLADITTQYSTLDSKYSEAFDAVNTRVDDILREGIPSTTAPTHDTATSPCAMRLLPRCPCRLLALQCLRRLMWSRTRPHLGMGEWTRGSPGICLAPMPRTNAWGLIKLDTRTAPICLGHRTSGIREA